MKLVFLSFCLLSTCFLFGEDIEGFWKGFNEATGKPKGVVAIYKYQDAYYGRIICGYDEEGNVNDTIYNPKAKAPGVAGNPFYCGMDFIWGLEFSGNTYKGKILDPKKGAVYNAQVWLLNDNLVVRGERFVFGKSQMWQRAQESDFPKHFQKPDFSTFIPLIPKIN
jgi:uncharacterized protein (DUF2147 family)